MSLFDFIDHWTLDNIWEIRHRLCMKEIISELLYRTRIRPWKRVVLGQLKDEVYRREVRRRALLVS